jgi:glycosyltransferase involved in cell wall biosynthesis
LSTTVVVVTNIPGPYRRALFATLDEHFAARDMDLRILYTSDPAKHVRRGPSAAVVRDPEAESFVPGLTFRVGYERVLTIPIHFGRILRGLEPACVVAGGFSMDAVIAANWCRSSGVPYVLWSGNWVGQEHEVSRLHLANRRRLVRLADAFIAYGSAAADYLVSLGAHPERVFCAWNTVDLEGISASARQAASRRGELVTKYRLAAKNLLFVGSLVERKGVRELVAAALGLHPDGGDWTLHLVGPGPLKDELETVTRTAGAEERFRFHGSLPKEDVAELLGVADGFVLPTKREPWGLVINEAMACGVPVVVSPWAGATRDLVEDGVTGYVIEPTDATALTMALSRLLSGDPLVAQVGRAGAEAVRAKASLERAANGFVSAVLCTLVDRQNARD